MSVSFYKTGTVLCDGDQVRKNLLLNSLELTGRTSSYIDSNGFTVGQHNGISGWSEAYWPLSISASGHPLSGKTLTISLDFMTNDITKTSGMFFGFGMWNSSSRIGDSNLSVSSYSILSGEITNNTWSRIYYVYTVPTTWSTTDGVTYRLQIKTNSSANGAIMYHKAIKIEEGSTPTAWIPNENDYGHIGDTFSFIENGDKMSIYEGHIETPEFIEY